MYVDLNPVFLLLVALLMALLAFAFVRRAGWKGWLVLSALLLVCAATNPSKADHLGRVRQKAGVAPFTRTATASTQDLMRLFRSGEFEPLVDYLDLGIASVVVMQGKPVSFGLLGQVWVTKLQRLSHRPGRGTLP
jgi:hypothetical protein